MPERKPITEEILNSILLVVKRNIKDFKEYPRKDTLSIVINNV